MSRINFFITPVNQYTVPRNPTIIDPVDEDYASWKGGLNVGNRVQRHYDNRDHILVWENLPATPTFVEMVHKFENYMYEDYLLMNVGYGIASGIYAGSNTSEYHRVWITGVETEIDNGKNTYYSGGNSYNVFSKVTLYYQDSGAV